MVGSTDIPGVKNSERGAVGGVITEGNSTACLKAFMDSARGITANAITGTMVRI
jgi:hypothetical protein